MSEEKKIGGRAFGETLNVEKFIEEQVALIREQVGDGKVLLALSGGVDSSVVAALLLRAIGDQLYCVHVNHGLMRKGESEQVIKVFREELGANLTYVDATDRFLDKLAGVSEPERKRKIIGEEFIHVFEEEAANLQGIHLLGQSSVRLPSTTPVVRMSGTMVKYCQTFASMPDFANSSRRMASDSRTAARRSRVIAPMHRTPRPGPGNG